MILSQLLPSSYPGSLTSILVSLLQTEHIGVGEEVGNGVVLLWHLLDMVVDTNI